MNDSQQPYEAGVYAARKGFSIKAPYVYKKDLFEKGWLSVEKSHRVLREGSIVWIGSYKDCLNYVLIQDNPEKFYIESR